MQSGPLPVLELWSWIETSLAIWVGSAGTAVPRPTVCSNIMVADAVPTVDLSHSKKQHTYDAQMHLETRVFEDYVPRGEFGSHIGIPSVI